MSINALKARIEELKEQIRKYNVEIDKCNTAKKETSTIVEDSSNCVKQLDCVASNLAEGIVLSGVPQGNGVKSMASNLENFKKNMEANIQALTEQIDNLEDNIDACNQEIAGLQAEIQRLEEEARIRAEAEAAVREAKRRFNSGAL